MLRRRSLIGQNSGRFYSKCLSSFWSNTRSLYLQGCGSSTPTDLWNQLFRKSDSVVQYVAPQLPQPGTVRAYSSGKMPLRILSRAVRIRDADACVRARLEIEQVDGSIVSRCVVDHQPQLSHRWSIACCSWMVFDRIVRERFDRTMTVTTKDRLPAVVRGPEVRQPGLQIWPQASCLKSEHLIANQHGTQALAVLPFSTGGIWCRI